MTDEPIAQAYAFLRSHTTGDLRFEEYLRPLKYVIAPDGRLVAPVMVAMLESVDSVLYVPETVEDALELQVTLEEFKERGSDLGGEAAGAAADRWRIYHGEPQDVRWAFISIDTARFERVVIDGEALMQPNPLTRDEARICRQMNQDHLEDIKLLCARFGAFEVEKPVMVGIDPLGIDVRAAFDVVRVPATEPMTTAEDALGVLMRMVQQARPNRE